MEKPSNIWAKLVSLHPDKENIHFLIKPDEKNLHQIDGAFKIFQDTIGNTWIQGLTKSLAKLNHTRLGTSRKKMIRGGETISLCEKDAFQNKQFDYIFCLVNAEPDNKLKRRREEGLEHVTNTLSEFSKKIFKVEDELEKELNCAICMEILHKSATLTPCQHTFCSPCLWKHLRLSSDCPLCQTKAVSVGTNLALQNLLKLLSSSFSNLQKPRDDPSQEQMDLRGSILRFQDGVYVGDCVDGKAEGKGTFAFHNGHIYSGEWKNNKKNGQGVLCQGGVKFKGKWSNGVMEPLGEIQDIDRSIYQGQIKNLRKHGKGVLQWTNGDLYDGDFCEDVRQGFGKCFYNSGCEYEGSWVQGNKHGRGTMKYANGNIYKGEWKNDQREGIGIFLIKSGDNYEGNWEKGLFHAFGKYTWEYGAEYEGGWHEAKRHGDGTLKYAHGDVYIGRWENGHREGQAVVKLKNGDILKGTWAKDALQPQVKIEYTNGDRYEGEINTKNYQRHGKGILIFKDGKRNDGFWKSDKFCNPE